MYNHKVRDDFPFCNMHNLSLLIVSAFSFLSSRAITSSKKWRLMKSMTVGVSRVFLDLRDNGCTVHHVECCNTRTTMCVHCSNWHIYWANRFQSWAFTFGCSKSQNLSRLHEITKISTRKIVAIPKSQKSILANNSNNMVTHFESLQSHSTTGWIPSKMPDSWHLKHTSVQFAKKMKIFD